MASPQEYLLKGVMPDISQMKKEALKIEVQMWRNVWNWVPHEVRYYVARVGSQVGLTARNYQRRLGILLDTHWNLEEIEIGVKEKVYDTSTGQYFWEQKVVKTKLGGLIDVQWIKERIEEEELLAKVGQEEKEEEYNNKIIKQDSRKLLPQSDP